VGEQHLDLFALTARGSVGFGFGNFAGQVTRPLVDRALDLASRFVWATTGFERARPAIVLAGSVVDHVVLHHTATRHGEPSAVALEGFASRAPVGVADMVISEVLAREGAVWALGFVEDWDVWLDPTVMNKPVQHLGRTIGSGPSSCLSPAKRKNNQEEVFMTRLGGAPALSRNVRSAHGNAWS
jgi:hypothetical protein